MNKKYYVAPQIEDVCLHTESAILNASPEGFSKDLVYDEEGYQELTREKNAFGSAPWSK